MRSGGKTAAHLTLANPTGVVAGTGVRVSGLTGSLGATNLGEDASLHLSPHDDGDMEEKGQGEVRKPSSTSTGKNRCPVQAPCRPFSDVFPTPTDLCEKIWSNTFKASSEHRNSGRCLQKWFEPTQGNPNVEVALHFASSASARELSYSLSAFSLYLLLHS